MANMLCDKMDSGSFSYATASEAAQLVSAIDFNFLRRYVEVNKSEGRTGLTRMSELAHELPL